MSDILTKAQKNLSRLPNGSSFCLSFPSILPSFSRKSLEEDSRCWTASSLAVESAYLVCLGPSRPDRCRSPIVFAIHQSL